MLRPLRNLTFVVLAGLAASVPPASAQYVSTRVGSFSTASAVFVDVTGGSLDFTPDAAGDIWILLFSARLMSTATALVPQSAEVRYLVNGIEHGYGGTQNQIANKGGPWQHFYRVTGTTTKQTVRVQIRDNAGATTTIQDLSVVAFQLPAGADFQYVETETTQAVPAGFATYESLSFTPASPGSYLVLALANATEDPGNGGIGVRVRDPGATFWPLDSKSNRLGHLSNPRIPWASFFLARAQNLTATPQTYLLEADGDATLGSTVKYTRLMAFRTDAFDAFESVEDTASSATSSTSPVVKSTLTTAAPPSARDYIVIQSQVLNGTDSTDEIRAGFETDDVQTMSHDHVISTQWNLGSYGAFDAITTSRATKFENTYATSNAVAPVDSKESVIHVLRLASNSCPCESLTTADGGTSLTVTSAGSFQMTFDEAFGGSLQDYRDLTQDPSLNLVSKPANNFHGLFHTSVNSGGTLYTSGTNADGAKLALLEATPTRVRVRQEHFYQRVLNPTILGGLKGTADYSVYPTGKLALHFRRRSTTSISFNNFPVEVSVWEEPAPDPRSDLAGYGESGLFGGNKPGGDDFVLAQRENAGGRTDFLGILYQDWAAADQLEYSGGVSFFSWRDTTTGTLPSDETWNLLFYLKQTNFVNHLDPGVTGRRDDYRVPDALTFGKGTAWSDADENTSADDFNEAEAAYLATVDPTPSTGGLTVSLDGEATNRYSPFLKVRHWRSLQDPASVTLDGVALSNDTHYRADVKPIARSFFAQDLRYHATFEDAATSSTSLDVGGNGTISGGANVPGRYGNGFQASAVGDHVSIDPADVDFARGALEFWVQPTWDSADGAEHNLGGFRTDLSNEWIFQKAVDNSLNFVITAGGTTSTVTVAAGSYSWRATEWVHLRFEWDDTAALGLQQRIFVNGVEPAHTDPLVDYNSASLATTNLRLGNYRTGAAGATGIYDEARLYGGAPSAPTSLANGGLAGDAGEFLARGSNNFDLAFSPVDALRRGEYLYLGSDTKFRGLNVDLVTNGVGAPNLQWQYWNGSAWADLEAVAGFTDETADLTGRGTIYWTADPGGPGGWVPYSVSGSPDLYYVRAYLINGTSYTTTPVEGLIKSDVLLFHYCDTITTNGQTFDFTLPAPTAVELVSFEASGLDRAIELTWRTASELDNLGFHLYRSPSRDGPYELITDALIPGLGSSPMGAQYVYRDHGLANGTPYFYKLEDVESGGARKLHGPVVAIPEAEGKISEPAPAELPGAESGPQPKAFVIYGRPENNALRVRRRGVTAVVVELVTEGFFVQPLGDGTARIVLPEFQASEEDETVSIPVRRAWVRALAGGEAEITKIRERGVESIGGLTLAATGTLELQAGYEGTVRARRRRREASDRRPHAHGMVPSEAARIVSIGFQGDEEKLLLELAPIRWSSRENLRLARRLEVTVTFRGEGSSLGPRARRTPPRANARGALARLRTGESGLYRIRFEEIFGGRGRSVSSRDLRLSRLGETVPYHLEPAVDRFGPGSTLYFVSVGGGANPYGTEAVYELETGAGGATMKLVDATPAGAPGPLYYWETIEREENRLYQPGLLKAPDLWLWDLLLAPSMKSFSFDASEIEVTGPAARVSIRLQGTSDFPGVDHHVRAFVNGSLLDESFWDGKEPVTLAGELPAGLLREGQNALEVENVGDTEAGHSMVMLDRFRVSYPRRLVAASGRLEGEWDASGRTAITGRVSPGDVVLDVTDEEPRWLSGLAGLAEGGIEFMAREGRRYLVVSAEAMRSPQVDAGVAPVRSWEGIGADYLAIGPKEFLEAARPLFALRREQGLAVVTAATEDLFATFGFGEPRPEAIEAFVSEAFHSWQPRPRYVLLLGDATYDFEDNLDRGLVNKVPPKIVKTTFLWTVSDPAYAAVHGSDPMPDLAIGRLPASTTEELETMVRKILDYETGSSPADGAIVLVADNPDSAGPFELHAEAIASRYFADRDLRKVYLGELGATRTREEIARAFDEGASLLSYLGHGGIHLWADENIFNLGDVRSLAPQPGQPLVLTMNCLNGYFHFPFFDSLAEALVGADGKGAIAAFAPSGLSLDAPAHRYHEALLDEIVNGDHERLGDAILAAQRTYAETGSFLELLSIYHLLGDPAMRLTISASNR